ncbi:MAG: response regulator transcription factor, partial [Gammaproteobacteria bacterium]|nr:response regulator transcription factor [Gammaproteobacteria bacterium]
MRELIARVKAILRRTRLDAEEADAGTPPTVRFGPLTVQFDKRRVLLDEQAVELTAKEFDLLALFAAHPGKPFNREQLLNQVWGYSYSGYEHTVNS